MGKYCCFLDPAKDYSDKQLTDKCPICGKEYGFPLTDYPRQIIHPATNVVYSITKPVGRGFYGSTYLCTKTSWFKPEKTLLKISPKRVYVAFGKDFNAHCRRHAELAENSEHLVPIRNAFDTPVKFGDIELDCHIAELEYIDGMTLEDFLLDEDNVEPRECAQIAIDILVIWEELKRQNAFHNDLHEGNLMVEILPPNLRRVDAICPRIRVKAIDLDSATDESLSTEIRTGDQRYISIHIQTLSRLLQEKYPNIESIEDSDFRLIETLSKISNILLPGTQNADAPDISELIRLIRFDFTSDTSYSPWTHEFTLAQFNEGLNAQTIHSCNIPKLLVDPGENWLREISGTGPQLITGMRGCGKTMLLGALDIHARLEGSERNEDPNEKINRVKSDGYIAISASCKSLLSHSEEQIHIFEILFWQYAIEIIRAANHIRYIDKAIINEEYHYNLVKVIETAFGIEISKDKYSTDRMLEKHLYYESTSLFDLKTGYTLKIPPVLAFEMLSKAFINVSKSFSGKKVFFLLDDASTRYLNETVIKLLIRTLIFQSPICAFKITTERQTLDLGISSPGNEEIADEFRDYQLFDLGASVYERIGDVNSGRTFIAEILKKRKAYYAQHPTANPERILGDCRLINIARTIHNTKSTSKERKAVYHGLSAITALCVGDIGDIITLYDLILQRHKGNNYPVSAQIQSSCFQDLCSRRMYNLENRNTALQKYALSFAQANHALLIKSSDDRIRQYTQLYVRITTVDRETQSKKLRELIDAGIFVFADGGTPRTKTRDTNPVLQFKLVFRKLFGLSNYIGLSNRDRFELSGEDLEAWLNNPSKEILCRNLGLRDDNEFDEEESDDLDKPSIEEIKGDIQLSMFQNEYIPVDNPIKDHFQLSKEYLYKRIQVPEYTDTKAFSCGDYTVLIAGLGFEDCGFESIKRVLSSFNNLKEAILVEYPLPGHSNEIKLFLKQVLPSLAIRTISYNEIDKMHEEIKKVSSQCSILDITSLNKPMIFTAVKTLLQYSAKFIGVSTNAKKYYPLDSDIDRLLKNQNKTTFTKLMSELYIGESGPYKLVPLLSSKQVLSGRPTSLIGILSPKNQRIFSLLDRREYESVVLLCQNGKTKADKLVEMAGQIAQINYENTAFEMVDISDLGSIIRSLTNVYDVMYNSEKMNVDLALTGTKLQSVLCAAFCMRYKINQCWYVEPNSYDSKHYSYGVGETKYFEVKVSE